MTGCTNHKKCIKKALNETQALCDKENLRLTETRRNVLEIIWQSHTGITAAAIMEKLGNNQPPVTYRALEFLESNGIIHKVASLNAYVGCASPAKEHASQLLICTTCKTVEEHPVDLSDLLPPTGFHAEQSYNEVLGVCERCYGG